MDTILEISPKDKLSFTGPFTKEVSTTLTLKNISNKSIYFKMKCNKSSGNFVNPSKGIVLQSQSISVKIAIQPLKGAPKPKHVKFLVQYLYCEDDTVLDDVDNVFNNYKKSIPYFLLECDFLDNPFYESTPLSTTSKEDLFEEIFKLRKENTALKEENESLKLAVTFTDINLQYPLKSGDQGSISLRKPIESIDEIKTFITSSFDKLIRKVNDRKESMFHQLTQTRDKFTSEKLIHQEQIFHYEEHLTRNSRALSNITDNFTLDVHHQVNEFVKSKVGELSQHFPNDPMVYFGLDLESFDSLLKTYVIFNIEDGLS